MNATKLLCNKCGWETELQNTYFCDICGYSLEVIYDFSELDKDEVADEFNNARSVWDYKKFLPVEDDKNIVSLSEGNTPLIKSCRIGNSMEIDLFFKDETRNPSSSFKDRPNSVAISVAKEMGIGEVTIASTGNAGSSLSMYAARAGMPCMVFVPENTPQAKITQILSHGAKVIKVKGNYADSYKVALDASRKFNWANLTSTYLNPFTVEGDKTIAYEIYRQLEISVPDWIVVPLGAGAMLSGIYKGFTELKYFGLIDKLPRMMGVQAEGCSPIIRAYRNHDTDVVAFENPSTIADAICDPLNGYAQDGSRTLNTIYRSSGAGIGVTDEEISKSMLDLAKKEAIFCEPGSATAMAAVEVAINNGTIGNGETVICIITGHGLKTIEEINTLLPQENYKVIESDINELTNFF